VITKLRKRYYCEHCGKGGGSAGHMRRHERTCTANPDRECEMCQHTELGHHEIPMAELVAMLPTKSDFAEIQYHEWYDIGGLPVDLEVNVTSRLAYPGLEEAVKQVMDALREAVGNCPACILAALRQADLCDQISSETFDYKREKKDLWDNVNDAESAWQDANKVIL